MDAALQTGKLSMDFFTSQVSKKDVTTISKTDEFKRIFQDKVKAKDDKFNVQRNEKKNDVSDTKEVENKSEEIKNKDVDDKEVKDEKIEETKDKKEKKKVEKEEDKNHEMTLEEKLQELLNKMDVELNEDVESTDVGESVDEVGLLTAETETITLNIEEDKETIELDVNDNGELGQEGLENIQDGMNLEDTSNDTDKENLKDTSKDNKFKLIDNRTQRDVNTEVVDNNFDVNLNSEVKGMQDVKGTSRMVENQERIDILKQVTDQIDVSLFDDKSEMIIKLKPEQLGKLTVQVSIENGNISAKFLAESEKVKEILESSFNQLKETLEQQGMNIQNLDVSVGNGNNNERYFLQKRMMMSKTKISRIDEGQVNVSNDYLGIETKNDVLKNYWPDSTVSFSA